MPLPNRLENAAPRLGALFTLLAVAWVFWPMAQFGNFQLDDPIHLGENREILSGKASDFLELWKKPDADAYTPLTRSLWFVESHFARQGGEFNAKVFHRGNLIVHLACVAIVFLLVWSATRSAVGATLAGLLFGLHPAQVEAVAWITGLRDILAGFFSLLSLVLYVRHARRAKGGIVPVLICYLAAVLSKPSAVGLPLAWVVIGLGPFARHPKEVIRELWPCLLVAPILLFQASAFSNMASTVVPPIPWTARPLVALDAFTFYLSKIMFPVSMGIDYGRTPRAALMSPGIFLTAAVPILLGIWLYFRRANPVARALSLAIVVSLSALVSASGLIPFVFQHISTTADRYLYTAFVGPAFFLGWISTRNRRRPTIALGGFMLIAVFALLSSAQLKTWSSDEPLYFQALKTNPRSWFAHHGLSAHYLRTREFPRALWHHRRFAELVTDPEKRSRAWQSLGALQLELGYAKETVFSLTYALELDPALEKRPERLNLARNRMAESLR